MPTTKPRAQEAEHQARGEAKTVKVPTTPGPRDERKIDTARLPTATASAGEETITDELFAGLAEVKDEQNQRKAERMEELGFHAQAKQIPVLSPTEAAALGHTELLAAANAAVHAAKVASAPTEAMAVVPGKDPKRNETRVLEAPASTSNSRTQTQELDDILSRIDKVLAENPVMAQSTIGSASHENTAISKPTTDVVVKKPTEAPVDALQQQKLF
jgi:hypothetical protein